MICETLGRPFGDEIDLSQESRTKPEVENRKITPVWLHKQGIANTRFPEILNDASIPTWKILDDEPCDIILKIETRANSSLSMSQL